jgi:hypothetical protein
MKEQESSNFFMAYLLSFQIFVVLDLQKVHMLCKHAVQTPWCYTNCHITLKWSNHTSNHSFAWHMHVSPSHFHCKRTLCLRSGLLSATNSIFPLATQNLSVCYANSSQNCMLRILLHATHPLSSQIFCAKIQEFLFCVCQTSCAYIHLIQRLSHRFVESIDTFEQTLTLSFTV